MGGVANIRIAASAIVRDKIEVLFISAPILNSVISNRDAIRNRLKCRSFPSQWNWYMVEMHRPAAKLSHYSSRVIFGAWPHGLTQFC
jgi:hypothetical protein